MTQVTFIGNLRGSPAWAKDFGGRQHIMPFPAKLDPAQFADVSGVQVAVSGAAAGNATAVPVAALTPSVLANTTLIAAGGVLIPAGTTLYFGGAKVATLTADAHIADTSLTVAPLPTALVGTETAIYSPYSGLYVPSGTLVSRTYAQRAANLPFRPAVVTDDEFFLTLFDVANAHLSNDVELYRPGSVVAENYLPQYLLLSTAANEVQTITITGAPTGGTAVLELGGVDVGVAYNAAAAAVQTAVQGFPAIGAGNATVTGAAGGPWTVTGAGALAGQPINLMTIDVSGLTGGTPGGSVVRTTPGGTPLLTRIRNTYQCIFAVN